MFYSIVIFNSLINSAYHVADIIFSHGNKYSKFINSYGTSNTLLAKIENKVTILKLKENKFDIKFDCTGVFWLGN